MDKIVISGGIPLCGEVQASGTKNSALPILASTILGGGECVISNVPRVVDVVTMGKLLDILGAEVQHEGNRAVIKADVIRSTQAPYDLVKTMRASVLVLGPLLARCGRATASLPGGSALGLRPAGPPPGRPLPAGCASGLRPVAQRVRGLQAMGAAIGIERGYMHAEALSADRGLHGARIVMDLVTVTGTENLMMAATLAEGTTLIENAAREPEVVDLAKCLEAMGAKIRGARRDGM